MNARLPILIALAATFAVAVACGGASAPTSTPTTPLATSTPEGESLPPTSGTDVRDYLEQVEYRTGWELWPGKGEKYEGTEPHGMLLTTYLNATAFQALTEQAGVMPDGSIIVKENFMPDGTYDAATVMYKVDGYDPDTNDWFWTKIAADGSIDAEGRVESCAACHEARSDNDFIFTGSLE